ncbi:L-threonylcarbamoyladenylate synthase [Pilibacter termitis]|uniref:Threonylcarbamoyl-AMP synthase n=1 Tax=Pilibacter termitis TaxID=263852 RepID=A0A1T4K7I1_9ENTE|nr:L-threonylcarbamoyladenylate synthase [Pilibacter termitis]SJZ38265.1 L-threonylcarbamoyladenylate synthase [Pilibacter termitis]
METKKLAKTEIKKAAELLKNGELVAFPTETVYGLGAIATNETAVKNVYLAKGRPSDNPLIIHVTDLEMVARYAKNIPKNAEILAEHFWAGPLTIILPLKEGILPSVVTGGLNTAAFRVPNNQDTLALIKEVGEGIVGPSANTSGKPSPTSAAHVLHDLNGKISAVLDGGVSEIGVESTVVDLSIPDVATILRPGAITEEMLNSLIPHVKMDEHFLSEKEKPKAPGMKYTHYSPNAKVYITEATPESFLAAINWAKAQGMSIGLLADKEILALFQNQVTATFELTTLHNIKLATKRLFEGLRALDEQNVEVIFAESFEEIGLGVAFMNRLKKAAGGEEFGGGRG